MKTGFTLRVIALVALVSLLLLGLGLGIPVSLLQHEKKTAHLLGANIAKVRAGEELELGLREARNQFHLFVITGDRAYHDAVSGLKESIGRWLDKADGLATTSREQALIGQVKRGYARFLGEFDGIAQRRSPELGCEVFVLAQSMLTDDILGPAHMDLDVNEETVQASNAEQGIPYPLPLGTPFSLLPSGCVVFPAIRLIRDGLLGGRGEEE